MVRRLGTAGFLAFYLAAAVISGLVYVDSQMPCRNGVLKLFCTRHGNDTPALGASGAIYAVMVRTSAQGFPLLCHQRGRPCCSAGYLQLADLLLEPARRIHLETGDVAARGRGGAGTIELPAAAAAALYVMQAGIESKLVEKKGAVQDFAFALSRMWPSWATGTEWLTSATWQAPPWGPCWPPHCIWPSGCGRLHACCTSRFPATPRAHQRGPIIHRGSSRPRRMDRRSG